jgi:predicted unusual protein kinase regulating ubiquinone biosynthesis (AarF/ABC1/UbiB family)
MRLRPLPFLFGTLAAGLAVVLRARRATQSESPVGATTRSRRNAAMAGLMTRRASDRAMTGARSLLAVDATRRRLRADLERREAHDVVKSLGHMKGALMKLGQMASYLDEALPEPMREALAQLRADAPPMSGDLALSEIERSLGRPLEDLFSTMDPTPIAAASIGQVHRAITIEGREVAVKVQYPGIADAIAADLDNTEALGSLLAMVFPGLDSGTLVEELRARLTEELDYHHEARSQASFADYYRHHPHIWVPDVIADLSTDRVLTTEFVRGEPFDTLYKRSKTDRNHYGEVLYRFVFRSLNRQLVFNGDPHPGNYIIADDGRLAFIDFGLVKHFEPSEVDQFVQLIRAMIDGDPARFRRTAERFQVLQPKAPFSDDEVYEWFASYYELILESKEIQVSAEYTSALLRQTFDARTNAILKYANVPPTFALIQRINLGVFTLLARLEATANWRDISEELWTFTDGPPSSPQGHAEADWLMAHPRGLPVS